MAVSKLVSDDAAWSERSSYWQREITFKTPTSRRSQSTRPLLILSGHGVRLRVHRGTLLVQNGFTHFPQDREEWRFFPGEWRLPSRIILVDGDGGLSFDAISWMANHNVPLIQINWRGDVSNIVGSGTGVVNPQLAELQRAAQTNGRAKLISRRLIQIKIANSIETLRAALPKSLVVDKAIRRLRGDLEVLRKSATLNGAQLRGIEGRVGYIYFRAWRTCEIHWKGSDRHPIPDDWRLMGPRSSKVSKKKHPNRNATHPVNAMLNYAYAILENEVRGKICAYGLDPSIGFLHRSYDHKLPLVYDLMEPLRPIVDRSILGLVQRHVFAPEDFTITPQGVCRLNTQLARNVVKAIDQLSDFDIYMTQWSSGLIPRN